MIGIALILASATTCALPVCLVSEVKPNVVALDGTTVRVRGWLRGCHRHFECQLGPTKGAEYEDTLTLDFVEHLEPMLGRMDGQEVVVRAKVTGKCSGEYICTDRAPELIPLSVERAR